MIASLNNSNPQFNLRKLMQDHKNGIFVSIGAVLAWLNLKYSWTAMLHIDWAPVLQGLIVGGAGGLGTLIVTKTPKLISSIYHFIKRKIALKKYKLWQKRRPNQQK